MLRTPTFCSTLILCKIIIVWNVLYVCVRTADVYYHGRFLCILGTIIEISVAKLVGPPKHNNMTVCNKYPIVRHSFMIKSFDTQLAIYK